MAAPGYQGIVDRDIPDLALKDDAGRLRLIAGEFDGQRGPARTFTDIDVWDIRLHAGKSATFDLHQGRNTALVVLHGAVTVRKWCAKGSWRCSSVTVRKSGLRPITMRKAVLFAFQSR